jgi:hypothetical protein
MSHPADEVKIGLGPCCFCGDLIDKSDTDPCSVTVETVAQKWQVWYCHAACFRVRLSDRPELDLGPAFF